LLVHVLPDGALVVVHAPIVHLLALEAIVEGHLLQHVLDALVVVMVANCRNSTPLVKSLDFNEQRDYFLQ